MARYETVFILTPVLSEAQTKETAQKFRSYLEKRGAEIISDEDWGLRKLAYPIQKKSTGFYHLIDFKVEGEIIAPLEVEFKRDERVIRFLTVRMDKHAAAYANKRIKKQESKSEAAAS